MKRTVVVLLALSFIAVACGDRNDAERELLAALGRTEKLAKTFVYREKVEAAAAVVETENTRARPPIRSQTNLVEGTFEDDFAYELKWKVDGTAAAEIVVKDDALAVKIVNAAKLPPQAISTRAFSSVGQEGGTDRELITALFGGQFVLDYTAAPPLIPPSTREGSFDVGGNAALDAAYIYQYVRRAIDEGVGVRIFNSDAIDYNPQDDPWASDADADLKAKGIKRYDINPPPLPRRSQTGSEAQRPTTQIFRKMSFYVLKERVVKIVEKIDIEGQREFRRIIAQDRGSDYNKKLLEAVKLGGTREALRQRTMSFEVFDLGDELSVELPVEQAVAGNLGPIFGGRASRGSTT